MRLVKHKSADLYLGLTRHPQPGLGAIYTVDLTDKKNNELIKSYDSVRLSAAEFNFDEKLTFWPHEDREIIVAWDKPPRKVKPEIFRDETK